MSNLSMRICPFQSCKVSTKVSQSCHIFHLDTKLAKRSGKACAQALAFHIEVEIKSSFTDKVRFGSLSSRVKVLFRIPFFTLIQEGDAIIVYYNPEYWVLHRINFVLNELLNTSLFKVGLTLNLCEIYYQFLTSNSNFKTKSNLQSFLFP